MIMQSRIQSLVSRFKAKHNELPNMIFIPIGDMHKFLVEASQSPYYYMDKTTGIYYYLVDPLTCTPQIPIDFSFYGNDIGVGVIGI